MLVFLFFYKAVQMDRSMVVGRDISLQIQKPDLSHVTSIVHISIVSVKNVLAQMLTPQNQINHKHMYLAP